MSNTQDTKQPPLEKPEPPKITPQTGELNAQQLDEVAGGTGLPSGSIGPHAPVGP